VAATVTLAQLGLWTNPYYDLLDAHEPVGVVARHRCFALAKGKVVSVHESGATSYSYVKFRPALDRRLHCYDLEAKCA
jgi:hypothetical protein